MSIQPSYLRPVARIANGLRSFEKITAPFFSRKFSSQDQDISFHIPHKFHAEMRRFDTSKTPFPDLHLAGDLSRAVEYNSFTTEKLLKMQPKIVSDYWRVAQVMHSKELIPIVHGQPSAWLIAHRVLSALGYENPQLLRFPQAAEENQEILKKVDHFSKNPEKIPFLWGLLSFQKPCDHTMQKDMLSATIGLFHYEYSESPVSFVFGGGYPGERNKLDPIRGNRSILYPEDSEKIIDGIITQAMQERGYNSDIVQKMLNNIKPLYKTAHFMSRGQLIVIGVPFQSCAYHAYHSHRGGVPTGISINTVLEKIAQGKLPSDGAQVRLLLSKELSAPESGIEVVNVMDESAVDLFCEGQPLILPSMSCILERFMVAANFKKSSKSAERSSAHWGFQSPEALKARGKIDRKEFNEFKSEIDQQIELLKIPDLIKNPKYTG